MISLYATIKKNGPPTENTPGAVGQDYVDTDTGLRYECVEAFYETSYNGSRTLYAWESRGLDMEFVADALASGGSGGSSLPVKLNIVETVCEYESITGTMEKYTFPSEVALNEGDLYLLVYRYFYNGFGDLSNHIFAVSKVIDGVVCWGHSDPENCVKMDKTGVYDEWRAVKDDTTSSIINVYKVQKVISDDTAYHVMHLEGYDCLAPGLHAHAEGCTTLASGMYSHAEGTNTRATGEHSHAEGFNTVAASRRQHVEGSYNALDKDHKYAHIVGNGTDGSNRSNAHTLDWDGNAWFAGNVEAKGIIISSSTSGSTKKFKITVNDEGTLTATEVTE